MSYKVIYGPEESIKKSFLSLPKLLYEKAELTQDYKTEGQILNKSHTLSKYFDIMPFVVIDESENSPAARCLLTFYPDDEAAYFGFFESVNNQKAADMLLSAVYDYARLQGKMKLVGPVDASFWIKYRLKTNLFNLLPYVGEPYNKKYYLDLLSQNGFAVQEHYISNIFPVVEDDYQNRKFQEHFQEFSEKGYEIKSPDKKDFTYTLERVYELLSDLYSDFPVFKPISKTDFMEIFKNYKYILDFDMVKMAYYKGDIVGFFISVPNYGTLPCNVTIMNFLKMQKIKKKPHEYVMLYMGVDREHLGLGKALSQVILQELKKKKVPSIGALARDGKVTQTYANDLVQDKYEYVLLEKEINNGYL